MENHWIIVVLCITFVGQLVLGSLFPSQDPSEFATQQEVQMQLPNLAMAREAAETINTRTIQVEEIKEQTVKNNLPIIIDNKQQHPVSEIVTIVKEEIENKKFQTSNNS